jgi:hypothetical protein
MGFLALQTLHIAQDYGHSNDPTGLPSLPIDSQG